MEFELYWNGECGALRPIQHTKKDNYWRYRARYRSYTAEMDRYHWAVQPMTFREWFDFNRD